MPGAVHEELDIKILILYALRRLSGPVDPSDLYDMCLTSGAVNYFDYSGCLADLVERQMISQDEEEFYLITRKGRQNVEAVESSLPYSLRSKMDRLLLPIDEKIQRAALVRTAVHKEKDAIIADLSMSDGVGTLIDLHILCADERQASIIRKNFKHHSEDYYQRFIQELSKEE